MPAAKPKITLICRHCTQPFSVKPSLATKAAYCSKPCKDDSKRTKVPRVCQQCQQTFLAYPQAISDGEALYCSQPCRGLAKRRPLVARFWEKVAKIDDDASCWLWTGATDTAGYGMVNVNQEAVRATHVAWELENGPLPEGQWTLHTCDTPGCVRNDGPYSHLYAGTHADNVRDRQARHRTASGLQNGSNTHPEVHLKRFPLATYDDICALYAAGQYTLKQLGDLYGVGPTTIWYIVKKQKHFPYAAATTVAPASKAT